MSLLRDTDLDPAPLAGRRIVIVGYGNQGRAQALNLRDGGHDVVVARRGEGPHPARGDGLTVLPLAEAAASADLVMLLVPDEHHAATWATIEPHLRPGAALGVSHGLSVRFGLIDPRLDLDVVMISPKGPGSALRDLYVAGDGMIGLIAVHRDASGCAEGLAHAYARAIGCGRAGVLVSTFEQETDSDLFNEQAVVWGAVPEILIAGFDTLVEGGIDPRLAYLECVSELKLLAGLIEARGLAAMRESISNTAELGGVLGGPTLVDDALRDKMRGMLAEIRNGAFARCLAEEASADYPRLRAARACAAELPVEAARRALGD